MEIFMRNIPYTADHITLTLQLAPIIHSPQFERYATSPGGLPINFKVFLLPDKRNRRHPHSGSGKLTVPNEQIGNVLLRDFRTIIMDGRTIFLQKSKNPPRPDHLGEVRLLPYRDPHAIREKEKRLADMSGIVYLRHVQFAWLCRDDKLSIEWQWDSDDEELFPEFLATYHLEFDEETREVKVKRSDENFITLMAIRYSRIEAVETDSATKTIVLFLETPPSFEKEENRGLAELFSPIPGLQIEKKRRLKLKYLNNSHAHVAPFTSDLLRLECESLTGLAEFKRMADLANLNPQDRPRSVERRRLFSETKQQLLQEWLRELDWSVAFQCEALHKGRHLDTLELLNIRSSINQLVDSHGPKYTTQMLRQFALYLRDFWYAEEAMTVQSIFALAREAIDQSGPELQAPKLDGSLFMCLHVQITPTGMKLRGPFPDTSNRILRQYPNNHDAFLRVSFTDEEGLKYRFDRREVDGARFIDEHVGTILKHGFRICGRHFEFLAYSQSALKQYTVWFVTQFRNSKGHVLNAESIRATVGSSWSKELLRCPARYAARLSQAFTATENSVVVEPDQVQRIPDIERNGFCFSDGNGPISQSLADAIHDALQRGSARTSRGRRTPSVFQVRIQGAKGVLCVDPTLDDFILGLRPSMVKFESTNNNDIEIARAFNKPGKFFLNRPLIMILGGLGVETDAFLKLQEDAVKQTQEASRSLKGAAELLETHGLGTAFALSSTFTNLRKLGMNFEQTVSSSGLLDPFMNRCMQFAVHHVLREIKFRARVPVPESWKLVGVVDVHKILREDQIYACIVGGDGAKPEYVEGPILISKSPTIHPGDVQIAFAIGIPPVGSPLRKLTNCVVFSQLGDRPLPNKLSGSDLDGDEYDLIKLSSMFPTRIMEPGSYPPARRKTLERDSTIDDVADFVVDFINNDMLGIVATNFLLIADRKGICANECAQLAELHSWAVDFPKNGEPVPFERIPQPEIRIKPDWFAPEIISTLDANYYESQTALGKMFRAIRLPPLAAASHDSRAQHRRQKIRESRGLSLVDTLERLSLSSNSLNDPISTKLQRRLRPLVDLEDDEEMALAMSTLFDYFAAELEHICFSYTLSRSAAARLTEEEILMGTIVAKSAQPRMRRDNISSMREETSTLVRRMWKELEGGEDTVIKDWVNRGWTAWRVSLIKQNLFGSKSFGWIALRAIFEAIKHLDEAS